MWLTLLQMIYIQTSFNYIAEDFEKYVSAMPKKKKHFTHLKMNRVFFTYPYNIIYFLR